MTRTITKTITCPDWCIVEHTFDAADREHRSTVLAEIKVPVEVADTGVVSVGAYQLIGPLEGEHGHPVIRLRVDSADPVELFVGTIDKIAEALRKAEALICAELDTAREASVVKHEVAELVAL